MAVEHDSPALEALFEASQRATTRQPGPLPNFKPEVAASLVPRWRAAYADALTVEQFKALADDTVAYLTELAAHLHEEKDFTGVDFF